MPESTEKKFPELPVKLNFYDWSGMLPPRNTPEWMELEKKQKKANKIETAILIIYGIISLFVIVIMFMVAYFWYEYLRSVLAVVVSIILFFVLWSILGKFIEDPIFDKKGRLVTNFNKNVWTLLTKHFPKAGWFSMEYNTKRFLYCKDYCGMFYRESGDLIMYSKECIKEVTRERRHVGTSGKIDGSNAHINHQYEWHLDIITSFTPNPVMSIILPDNKESEELIAGAYANILSGIH
jgi:hypothetical protein